MARRVPKRTFQLMQRLVDSRAVKNAIRYKCGNFYAFTKEFQGDNSIYSKMRYMWVQYVCLTVFNILGSDDIVAGTIVTSRTKKCNCHAKTILTIFHSSI